MRSLLPLALLVLACRSAPTPPDLGALYERSAQSHTGDRNPVIVIPGLLGSSLVSDSGETVWGAFAGEYADPRKAPGARAIALPMREGATLAELVDGVEQAGALESVRLTVFGLSIGVKAYFQILTALGAFGGYRDASIRDVDYGDDHFTCFQFAYDWRRDLAETAVAFDAFVAQKKAYVEAEYARRGVDVGEVRFDVVAHSMGGLLLRYWLRHGGTPLPADGSLPPLTWAGAEHVERAVLVGTPNAGSLKAWLELLHGTKLGPFTPRYRPAIVGTMPAAYQLLPRERHGAWRTPNGEAFPDVLDVATWDRCGWGPLDPDEADLLADLLPDEADPARRRAIARDHVAKCLARAAQLHAALDRPAAPPEGTELVLAAGDATPTPAVAVLDPDGGWAREVVDGPGDETVLRTSALLDERVGGAWEPRLVSPVAWERVMFFFDDHLGLVTDPAFLDNLLFLLLEEPR